MNRSSSCGGESEHAVKRSGIVAMVTLYKRATASQRRVLRIVEGAIKNAADAHPEFRFTPRIARSIAKRAAGTLTAQWPDVLAAKMPSGRSDQTPGASIGAPIPHLRRVSGKGLRTSAHPQPQLRKMWKWLSIEVGAAKRAGAIERAQAFIEVLKRIDAMATNASGQ